MRAFNIYADDLNEYIKSGKLGPVNPEEKIGKVRGIRAVELYADFTFDRAGQGLFYHGQIRSSNQTFLMAYDCGTIGNKKNLSEIVSRFNKEYILKRQRLGLLAISHFDLDHISHIPELLRECKCDTVMLPHIAKEIRAVFFAKFVTEEKENGSQEYHRDFSWFFRDPVGYMGEMSGARQIIGIQSDDDYPDDNSSDKNVMPIKPFYPNESKDSVDSETPQLLYVGGGKHIQTGENNSDRYFVYSGSPVFRVEFNRLSWLFKPLNVQDKLPPSFFNDVDRILCRYEDDWQKLLSNKDAIERLKNIYDLYIGQGRRNAHSLLLRHEPEQHARPLASAYIPCKHNCIHCLECCDLCYRQGFHDNFATILLGDLKLDDKARAVLNEQRFIDYRVKAVLIPHHGADSDDLLWLNEKVRGNGSCASLVVSYGINNRYKHPRFIYDGTMARIKNSIVFVNEDNEYRYDIFVHG